MSKADLKKIIDSINKKREIPLVNFYGDLSDIELERISTGLPSLDWVLGGGLPMGRIIDIYGNESSGKSSLAIHSLIEVQKAYPDSFQVYIDTEHSMDGTYAKTLGLDMDKIIFSQPDTAEEALDLLNEFAGTKGITAIVFDSIAQMPTAKEVNGNSGDAEMGMRARLLSQSMRKLAPLAERNKTLILLINQIRTNLGVMFGSPETVPGGGAIKFASSIRIRTATKKDKEGLTGITTFKCIKNKVGMPFRETEIEIEFGKGFNKDKDLINFSILKGIINQSGNSYSFGNNRWIGKDKAYKDFIENKALLEELREVTKNSLTE